MIRPEEVRVDACVKKKKAYHINIVLHVFLLSQTL